MRTDTGVAPIGYRATPIAESAVMPAPISLHAVNGWRGIGALAIVFGHLWLVTGFIRYGDLRPIALLVDLFFVLSGLLIAQVYVDRLSRVSAMPEYIVRRFGRIWPVHATMLAILVAYEFVKLILETRFGKQFSTPAFSADGGNSIHAIWTNLLLVQSLGVHDSETWNFPSWSLSVEFFTYVVFAAFCLLRPAARHVASLLVIVASIAILMAIAPIHMRSTFDYGVFRCTAGFFAGSLLNDVLKRLRLPVIPAPTVVECLGLGLVIVWMVTCFDNALAFAAPIVFCLFILAFIQGRGAVSRVLLTKPFQFLAELSFTIYMVHAVILVLLLAALHAFEHADGMVLFASFLNPHPIPGTPAAVIQVIEPRSTTVMIAIAGGYVASVVLASYVAYRFVEIPGRVAFGKIAKRLDVRIQQAANSAPHRASSGMRST